LVSVLIWSIFGTLPDTLKVNALVQDGSAVCYVDSPAASKLKTGMTAEIGEASGTIVHVSQSPVSIAQLREKLTDEYILAMLIAGDWNYPVQVGISGLPDGGYEMLITVERIKPFSFLWN